jgi:phospholipid/cholesterol/gamma-HCH transport system substrate-binding protein
MQSTSPGRDLGVGLFVLLGLSGMVYLSVQLGGMSYGGSGGLELVATFDDVGGLSARAPAMISGVTVGRVREISLDPMLRARVVLDLDRGLELPVDTSASIRTQGILGEKFVSLEPGAEDAVLQPGEEIDFTQSALNLESLIGTLVHSVGFEDDDE